MKILVIRFRQTGDLTLNTQIPYVIKKHLPDAEIHYLTYGIHKGLIEHNPYVSKVLTFNKKDGLLKYIALILKVRREKYDAIIDSQNYPRTAKIVWFSGAKRTITFADSRRKFFYNELAPRLKGSVTDHIMSLPAKLIGEGFSVTQEEKRPQIYLSHETIKKAEQTIASLGFDLNDLLISVSPTQKTITRRWKPEYFAAVIEHLVRKYNAKVILTHGPGEEEYINEHFRESDNIRILPKMTLTDFAGVLSKMKLHFGNDSGPHHLATAFKVPTFVVIGSSSPHWVFPSELHTYAAKGLSCQPCKHGTCRISEDIPCMKDFTPDEVIPLLDDFINKRELV